MDNWLPGSSDDRLKINRLSETNRARPWDRYDRLYRDTTTPFQLEKKSDEQPASESKKRENDEESSPNSKKREVKETVTISLERYEQLRQSQERLAQLEDRLRKMTEYQLVSVAAERAIYHVNVDQAELKTWLSEMVDHKNVEIKSIAWNTRNGGNNE